MGYSKEDWDAQHSANDDKPIIVDFTATWCGPCRMIGPYFEQLSTEFGIVFLKVRQRTSQQRGAAQQRGSAAAGARLAPR